MYMHTHRGHLAAKHEQSTPCMCSDGGSPVPWPHSFFDCMLARVAHRLFLTTNAVGLCRLHTAMLPRGPQRRKAASIIRCVLTIGFLGIGALALIPAVRLVPFDASSPLPPREEEGEACVGICCQRDSMRPLLQARALDSARSSVCVQMERRPWLQQPCGVCPSLASMPMFAHAEHFAPCFSSLCAFLRVAEVGRCSLMLNQFVHYAVRRPNLRWLRLVLIPQDVRTIWWMRSLLCLPGPHPLFPSVFFPV